MTLALARAVKIPVIASGGLASMADIERLVEPDCAILGGAISGRALYDGRIDPIRRWRCCAHSPGTRPMLKVRLIPCLDVKDGRVVKGVQFVDLIDAGDPVEAAKAYDAAGADELCFLDITASVEARGILFDVVRRTAEACFMPLTVGGGVRKVEDIRNLLLAGADKVSINTAAVNNPDFVARSRREIRQPVRRRGDRRQESVAGRRAPIAGKSSPMAAATPTGIDAVAFARRWRSSAPANCSSPPWTATAPRAATIWR